MVVTNWITNTEKELVDILFIEITHPDNYNFQLLNQAEATCRKRFPGSQFYYFQGKIAPRKNLIGG